ncbi:endolytic transglycosylase MltG [Bacillus methanolicus]|uniref:Aminodeoxychorismate lyase n=1 Tax=Bacillus methanolicus (strain MGA3 / ATCC 53907) TaxID=796606 RepID=I3EAH9_BACMM|nr:endolytic transglycosylase MltG [Bacillus methanolicus]AIE60740.1 aminodeoxychorismate lyase [Bacillus methanolicus MGA3]EIJ83500.1 hypothetical protein MGA3_09780 [Bacillus methanolicus MGA3]UQD52751.1 aminodeoxychorismate lyase [Bacillus methanolicus]
MNKRTVRAFALGILFSVSLIGSAYYFLQNGKSSLSKAKQSLEEKGYIVLSKSEYTNLQKQSKRKNEEKQSQETVKKTENSPLNVHTEKGNEQSSGSYSEENNVISYELKITSGMNTEQIASILSNVRIIKDAQDFEEFMSNNGYSTKIQQGTFHLTNKMNYSQIAKILTKS